MSSKTWFEERAQEMLTARGAKERPRELYCDIADALEKAYEDGRRRGLSEVSDVVSRGRMFLSELEKEIATVKK